MKQPLIFNIIRGSTVDGPGMRTTVFFKGCNLSCRWCHNPEGRNGSRELAFFVSKCVGCGACKAVCNKLSECKVCGNCAKVCKMQARKIYGEYMTAYEIAETVAKDKLFYDSCGGGVTFSGGECMLYPEFLSETAKLCKDKGISVAIDTAGCVPFSSFEKVLTYADLFLYDIKCITAETHKRFTGVDNRLILDNFERLLSLDAKIIVRVPMIDGFNDGDEMLKIKAYLSDKNVPVEYLPYHDMGESKAAALAAAKNL